MTSVAAEPLPDELLPAEQLAALMRRHEAAVRLLPDTATPEERVLLLAAVVAPVDERLRSLER